MKKESKKVKPTDFMKLQQNTAAKKIKDLLIRVSVEADLPEKYQFRDFKIVEDYIEHTTEYADVKIEIKNRYSISPTIIMQKGTAGKGNSKLLAVKGWLIEELLSAGSSEEPARVDHKTIGKVSGAADVVRIILLVDASAIIDERLHFAAEEDEKIAIEEEWKKCLL